MKDCWKLFQKFFKIGALTFGGGYAMIPIIQHELVEKMKWLDDKEILEIVAIAESTPGPIAINMATFVGYKKEKIKGAFFATLGVVLPSFLIILIIAFFLRQFQELKVVQYAFNGIRAGVLALVIKSLVSMNKKCKHDKLFYIVVVMVLISVLALNINVIFMIFASALVGAIYSLYFEKGSKEVKDGEDCK